MRIKPSPCNVSLSVPLLALSLSPAQARAVSDRILRICSASATTAGVITRLCRIDGDQLQNSKVFGKISNSVWFDLKSALGTRQFFCSRIAEEVVQTTLTEGMAAAKHSGTSNDQIVVFHAD
jgi:hypothetical protein